MGGPYGRGRGSWASRTGRAALFSAALAVTAAPAAAQSADPLHQALDGYALYQSDVSALLDANIADAAALDAALERMARHDPQTLTRGWTAYNAMTAAQSPAFIAGVRSRVRAAGRDAVLRQLRNDLTYARRRPPGDAEATQLIVAAVEGDTARMNLAAGRYEALGRDLDVSAWTPGQDRTTRHVHLTSLVVSETLAPGMLERLHIGAGAANPLSDPRAFGGRSFWDALAARNVQLPPPRPMRERWLGGADRMRTLAALVIVGATQSESARVDTLLDDGQTQYCLRLEQLQLRQCAASAHSPDEDALCLGRHAFAGPSACFGALLAPL